MVRTSMRPVAALLTGFLVFAACTADEASTPSARPETAALADQVAGTAEVPPCAAEAGVAGDIPGWQLGSSDPDFMPMVMSTLLTGGYNRFLYNVYDQTHRQMASPELNSRVDFYALERDPGTPASRAGAAYLSSGLGRGLYRTEVRFDCIGEWGAEIHLEGADGEWSSERLRFQVNPLGTTPAIGEPGPRSDSLTAATPEEAARISTDLNPYLPAYDKTVAQTVTSGSPSLVFCATPAFCLTGFCGPTVELVKSVAREHEGALEFVNVEPYELHTTENGLQPLLSDEGH